MKVQDWYQRLPERDQQIALLGGAAAGVLLDRPARLVAGRLRRKRGNAR